MRVYVWGEEVEGPQTLKCISHQLLFLGQFSGTIDKPGTNFVCPKFEVLAHLFLTLDSIEWRRKLLEYLQKIVELSMASLDIYAGREGRGGGGGGGG